ncbi:hypothetical protein BCEP4_590020 [Burkholderia cepacia]|nr:hypothetical protein BCEP4_590020 [Burkholderia cepacia]
MNQILSCRLSVHVGQQFLQSIASFQQRGQLGYASHNFHRLKRSNRREGQVNRNYGSVVRQRILHVITERRRNLRHPFIKILNVNFRKTALVHSSQRFDVVTRQIRHHARYERKLDFFLRAIDLNVVLDLNPRSTTLPDKFLPIILTRHLSRSQVSILPPDLNRTRQPLRQLRTIRVKLHHQFREINANHFSHPPQNY